MSGALRQPKGKPAGLGSPGAAVPREMEIISELLFFKQSPNIYCKSGLEGEAAALLPISSPLR